MRKSKYKNITVHRYILQIEILSWFRSQTVTMLSIEDAIHKVFKFINRKRTLQVISDIPDAIDW